MTALADVIDDGLALYYEDMGRDDYKNEDGIGKFKNYCIEGGFDEDDQIQYELEQPDPEDCGFTELDVSDDEETNNFPFSQPIEDPIAQKKEIQRILNDIAKYGKVKKVVQPMKLSLKMCIDLSKDELDKYSQGYTQQMGALDKHQDKDLKYVYAHMCSWYTISTHRCVHLRYYLAVGMKHNFPFLTYLVDAFTKEKADHHYKSKQNELKQLNLEVGTWAMKNKFCKALKRYYPRNELQLRQAMTSYSNRILTRLQFEPSYKIDDSLQQIAEYIVSIPLFINQYHGPGVLCIQSDTL